MPDVPYHLAINRMLAHRPVKSRIGLGTKSLSMNRFVMTVAPTGSGKDFTASVSKKLMSYVDTDVAQIIVTTGQGLYRAYFDSQEDDRGRVKMERIHAHALAEVSEGASLTAYLKDPKFKLASTLCAMWMGAEVGGGGASEEAKIRLEEGSYVFDMTLAIQPENALDLVELTKTTGLGGRMVYTDPRIPPEWVDRDDWPETVDSPFNEAMEWMQTVGITVWELSDSIIADLNRLSRLNRTGMGSTTPLDAHQGLVTAKEYAALMQLHCGRMDPDTAWSLAQVIWETSREVRMQSEASGREERNMTMALRRAENAEDSMARYAAIEELKTGVNVFVKQAAASMARAVHDGGGRVMSDGELVNNWKGRRARQFREGSALSFKDEVQRYAKKQGWVKRAEGGWKPGPDKPE